jgi:hypothetical protein
MTHTGGTIEDAGSDRPAAHLSARLTLTDTGVPGRIVFNNGSDG